MTKLTALVALLVVAGAPREGAAEDRVTFFDLPQYLGENYTETIKDNECYNLPGAFNNRASSVSTHGGCVVLFDEEECTGGELQAQPGTASLEDLKGQTFDNRVSSFKVCSEDTPEEDPVTAPPSEVEVEKGESVEVDKVDTEVMMDNHVKVDKEEKQEARISFYYDPNYAGSYYTFFYTDKRCYNVPLHWTNRALSVNNFGNCVMLYEYLNCGGTSLEMDRNTRELQSRVNSFQSC